MNKNHITHKTRIVNNVLFVAFYHIMEVIKHLRNEGRRSFELTLNLTVLPHYCHEKASFLYYNELNYSVCYQWKMEEK